MGNLGNWFVDAITQYQSNPAIAAGGVEPTAKSRANNRTHPIRLLSEASYMDGYRLGWINKRQYFSYMRDLGYSESQALIAYKNTTAYLTSAEQTTKRFADTFEKILKHYDGGAKTDFNHQTLFNIKREYCESMYALGYDKEESEKLFHALRPVPTFSILLEWLAKEAFEPKVIEKFGLLDDYPKIFADIMQALGVPPEEAKRYWIAHWNHPPLGQLMDMYHKLRPDRKDRNPAYAAGAGVELDDLDFDKEALTEALKLWEIPPYWRDRMIANSYLPLPFTVIQQVYQYGLEDVDWVRGRLLDYRYAPGDAEVLLNTWKRKFPYAYKAPLASNLFRQLERGTVSITEVERQLSDKGLSADDITYFIQTATDRKYLIKEKIAISAARRLYQKKAMTDEQLAELVKTADIHENRRPEAINIIKAGDAGAFTRLNVRAIGAGLRNGAITTEEARAKLESIRLLDEDLDLALKIFQDTTIGGDGT